MLSRPDPHQVVPGRHPPGARAPRPRPPHGADHRRPRLRGRAAAAAVRRHRLRRPSPRERDGRYTGQMPEAPPTGESRARRCSTTPTPRTSTSPRRSPTPTRPTTCPCSRWSASPSRSTPRPAWPPSPASGAGWSRSGRRPPAAPPACSRLAARRGHRGCSPAAAARRRSPVKAILLRAQAGPVRGRRGGRPGRARAGRRRSGRCGWPTSTRPSAPGRRLGAAPAPPRRHLRQRPGHHRRPLVAATSSRSCRFPFTPGHEVVGDLDDGSRAVLVPVLPCATRGIDPLCPGCADRRTSTAASASPSATSSPASRRGFCTRHRRRLVHRAGRPPDQLLPVPDGHARRAGRHGRAHRLRRPRRPLAPGHRSADGTVAVIGAGTLGLLTHRRPPPPHAGRHARIIATAKHPAAAAAGHRARRRLGGRARASCAGPSAPPPARFVVGEPAAPAAPTWSSTASARPTRSPRPSASPAPAARCWSSACPATPPSTSPRSGTGRPRCGAATPTPVDDFEAALGLVARGRPRPPGVAPPTPCPATREAIEHAATAGSPRRGEDRLRPPRREGAQPMKRTADAPSRLRPRRRPLDPAHPVPPRRGRSGSRSCPPGGPASSTRRAARPDRRRRPGHPGRPAPPARLRPAARAPVGRA